MHHAVVAATDATSAASTHPDTSNHAGNHPFTATVDTLLLVASTEPDILDADTPAATVRPATADTNLTTGTSTQSRCSTRTPILAPNLSLYPAMGTERAKSSL